MRGCWLQLTGGWMAAKVADGKIFRGMEAGNTLPLKSYRRGELLQRGKMGIR